MYISSVFLKHLIETTKNDDVREFYLSLDETEPIPDHLTRGISSYPRTLICPFPCLIVKMVIYVLFGLCWARRVQGLQIASPECVTFELFGALVKGLFFHSPAVKYIIDDTQ